MNRFAICAAIAIAIGIVTTATPLWAQRGLDDDWRRQAALHGWRFDYQEARQVAEQSGKPLMLVFRCVP